MLALIKQVCLPFVLGARGEKGSSKSALMKPVDHHELHIIVAIYWLIKKPNKGKKIKSVGSRKGRCCMVRPTMHDLTLPKLAACELASSRSIAFRSPADVTESFAACRHHVFAALHGFDNMTRRTEL